MDPVDRTETRAVRARRLARAAARMEAGVWRSLFLVVTRRRPGQGPGVETFRYAREVVPLLWAFLAVSLVELPVVHVLLPWETVRLVVLVVSVWGLLWTAGLLASMKVFPHLQSADGMRLRYGATVDVEVPWSAVQDVRGGRGSYPGSTVQTVEDEDGTTAVVAVMRQTKVDIRFLEPTTIALPDGPVEVVRLRVYADRPHDFVAAARTRLEAFRERTSAG